MTFEEVLEQHKKEVVEALILFNEGHRVSKFLKEIEALRPEFYRFYQEGYESGRKGEKSKQSATGKDDYTWTGKYN